MGVFLSYLVTRTTGPSSIIPVNNLGSKGQLGSSRGQILNLLILQKYLCHLVVLDERWKRFHSDPALWPMVKGSKVKQGQIPNLLILQKYLCHLVVLDERWKRFHSDPALWPMVKGSKVKQGQISNLLILQKYLCHHSAVIVTLNERSNKVKCKNTYAIL